MEHMILWKATEH